MKFVPWKPDISAPAPPQERTAILAVVQEADHTYLAEVDEKGKVVEAGRLIEVKSNGTFEACAAVNVTLGYPFDEERRVIINL